MTRPISGTAGAFSVRLAPWPDPAPGLAAQALTLLRPGQDTAVTGQLVCGSGEPGGEPGAGQCVDVLAVSPAMGLAAFPRDEAPARGLVATLSPGQVALVLRNPRMVGLSVEEAPLPAVARRAIGRLSQFGKLGGDTPERILCLPMAGLSAADRRDLGVLASALRLAVQDAPQAVVMVDACGEIHTDWPVDVRFEADQPPP